MEVLLTRNNKGGEDDMNSDATGHSTVLLALSIREKDL
jgi:hypothetical protein